MQAPLKRLAEAINPKPRRIFLLVFFFSLIYIALTVHISRDGVYSSLFDDAMISFRYARNIATGVGPYWNQGDRVEGFTNPLWTYLMAAVLLLTDSREKLAPLLIQIIAALLLAGNCYLFARVASRLRDKAIQAGGAAGWLNIASLGASLSPVAFYPNIYWTLMGMEVALLSVLASLLFVVIFYEEICDDPLRLLGRRLDARPIVFAICLAGQLTRPDFILMPASLLAARFIFADQSARKQLYAWIAFSLFGVLSGALALSVWRGYYFDTNVPNTYLLKVKGVELATQILSGLGFVRPMLIAYLPLLAIGALVWATSSRKVARAMLAAAYFYFAAVLLYQIRVGGDPWSYWRAFAGSLVLLGFACFVSLLLSNPRVSISLRLTNSSRSFNRPVILSVAALLCLSLLIGNLRFITTDFLLPLRQLATAGEPFSVFSVMRNRVNINSARVLTRILPKGSTVAALEAGVLPYYMIDYYAVDLLGKSDAHIASLKDRGGVSWEGMITVPGHNKYDLKWSLNHYKPDWIQASKWGRDDLAATREFKENYVYCDQSKGYLNKKFASLCSPG